MSNAEGKEDNNALEIEEKFENMREIIGRQSKINDIVNDLKTLQPDRPFVVMGPPGIGKTEICRCVYKELKEEISDLYMPYVDCMSVNDINALIKLIIRVIGVYVPEGTSFEDTWSLIKIHLAKINENRSKVVIYFDNWESIWYNLKNQDSDMDLLIKLLQLIKACGCFSLISTTTCLEGIEIKEYDIPILESPYDRELFLSIYTTKDKQLDEESLSKLLEELTGYPLAIVLVAYQAKRYPNLNLVLDKWRTAHANTGVSKHKSMEVAVNMSWNSIDQSECAKEIWGVMSIVYGDISYVLLQEIMEPKYSKEWMGGLEELIKINVITYKNKCVSMLSPLKNLCFVYASNNDSEFKNKCLIRTGEAILNRLVNVYNSYPNFSDSNQHVINIIEVILNVMSQMSEFRTREMKDLLCKLVYGMNNYFIYSYKSTEVLSKLVKYYEDYEDRNLLPYILRNLGELQMRFTSDDSAIHCFSEAIKLYRLNNDDLGLANALRGYGDLLFQVNDQIGATEKYNEAVCLYRKTGSKLGLANVLFNLGTVKAYFFERSKSNEKNYEEACSFYENANELYSEIGENWGLANVHKNYGDLHALKGDNKRAVIEYKNAIRIYEAEKLILSIANVYRSLAIMYIRSSEQNNIEEAVKILVNLVGIYEKERYYKMVDDIKNIIVEARSIIENKTF